MPVVRPGQYLSTQCRFAVGGQADFFVTVSSGDEMFSAFEFAFDRKLPTFVYSGGSNLFFDDEGFRGLVIRLRGGDWQLAWRDLPEDLPRYDGRDSLAANQPTDDLNGAVQLDLSDPDDADTQPDDGIHNNLGPELVNTQVVKVGGGFELGRLVRELSRLDLGGIEFLANIPGSIAGAVAGNAGCYGRAIAEVLVEAEIYSLATHEVATVGPEFFDFRYRHSKLKYDSHNFIVSATLRLAKRSRSEIISEVEAELTERQRKHPHDSACAGSFFQNPSRERPAWKLIEEAGLKGASIGAAQLSTKHANFLVNTGGASSADIIRLARQAQRAVLEHSGFELQPEVRYVGPLGLVDNLPEL